jgi:ABC-2 type transport system permease protein
MKRVRRILAVARKEVFHIFRDKRSLGVAILMPLGMLVIYGYALDTELENLPVGIMDLDRTAESRDLVRRMTSSGFIVEAARVGSRAAVESGFRRRTYRAVVVIPRGYSEDLLTTRSVDVQVLIDGADGSTAATVDNYMRAVLAMASAEEQATETGSSFVPVDARVRIHFNPELESANFIVPGLVALVLIMICALLASVALTREKETGTLEQVLTTPVTRGQVVVGKLLPYSVIGALDAALIVTVGKIVFDVPMEGHWWALASYSLLFVFVALALGLMISAVAGTQRVAMIMALLITFLPTLLLSGFIFDHSSMPAVLRWLAQVIPATHYLQIVYGIMLKGATWFPRQTVVLLVMFVALMAASTRSFRTTME